eukprot:tig00020848_g14546.t1
MKKAKAQLPKHLEEQRRAVTANFDAPVYTGNFDYSGSFSSLGIDNTWSLESFQENLKVEVVSWDREVAVIDVSGIDAPIANAIRRILLSEIPTMAIEKVWMQNNTSIIPDEILAHRLGLIPIMADPRKFEMKGEEDDATEKNTIVFRLQAKCTRKPGQPVGGKDDDENLIQSKVLSKDLEWIPHGQQAEAYASNPIKPIHDDILIAKLRPGQEIEVECHCVKGIGKTHAKWSPVATATYRLMPEIDLIDSFDGEEADQLVATCPMKVFDIEDLAGGKKAVVRRPRNCTLCRECIRSPDWQKRIKLKRLKSHFIFTIESTGALAPHVLFQEAIKILIEKCEVVIRSMAEVTNKQ